MKFSTIRIVAFWLIFSACTFFGKTENEEWVARVGNAVLYRSDVERVFPSFDSPADSLQQTQFYIDNWIRQQLILEKAREYLNAEEKELDAMVEQYRNAVLRNRYEQKLLEQKMDTVTTDKSIAAYYEENKKDFILQQPIFRARMLTVPSDAPRIDELRSWLSHNGNEESQERLEEYAAKFSTRSALSDSVWYSNRDLYAILPGLTALAAWVPKEGSYEAVNDSTFIYAIFVLDQKKTGEYAPLSYVKEQVRSVLLQQRRVAFLESLENNLFDEALERGGFEIKTDRNED